MIIEGKPTKPAVSEQLLNFFKKHTTQNGVFDEENYILYQGAPTITNSDGESLTFDMVWISKQKGIIIFDLVEDNDESIQDIKVRQDKLYNRLEAFLSEHIELKKGRKLAVNLEVFTFGAGLTEASENYVFSSENSLKGSLEALGEWDSNDLYKNVLEVVQNMKLKKTRERATKKEASKGTILKRLENTLSNLDTQQDKAVISYHEGIQRIRGLAGSGKTIVLALKAAHLHQMNSEKRIAITFNTRALKGQFNEIIENFCIQKMRKKPDNQYLEVIHAWGGKMRTGIYYEFCKCCGIVPIDFREAQAKNKLSSLSAFDYVCTEALNYVEKNNIFTERFQIYDAILIDEAQDLPVSFLRMCHKMLRPNPNTGKRQLVYAYDELQTLNEGEALPSPHEIFGETADDTILKKCYRNAKAVLTTAHALGFGIYRTNGLVQFFDAPQLWEDMGYELKEGVLEPRKEVWLERRVEANNELIEAEISQEDLIQFEAFENKEKQDEAVVQAILQNLREDELELRDIVVIDPLGYKGRFNYIGKRLYQERVKTHIAGAMNPDVFMEENSITFTGIHRAKGNEVPMVYIINADECYQHPFSKERDLIRRRNSLFTAITRSKAWVRVFGVGDFMEKLKAEYEAVKYEGFVLKFTYPNREEIEKMNRIRRDISENEVQEIQRETNLLNDLERIMESIKSGKKLITDYPEKYHSMLTKLINS